MLMLAALPLAAHVISFSSGEMEISGARGVYELRMPLYEIAHMTGPRESIFRSIRFSAGGRAARLLDASCREDPGAGAYICRGEYEFETPVKRLEVECRFHAITVPNHVHLLHATRGGDGGRAVLDLSFPTATVDFEPPGAAAVALAQSGAGAGRAFTPVQLLFLACLVLAARSRRELAAGPLRGGRGGPHGGVPGGGDPAAAEGRVALGGGRGAGGFPRPLLRAFSSCFRVQRRLGDGGRGAGPGRPARSACPAFPPRGAMAGALPPRSGGRLLPVRRRRRLVRDAAGGVIAPRYTTK